MHGVKERASLFSSRGERGRAPWQSDRRQRPLAAPLSSVSLTRLGAEVIGAKELRSFHLEVKKAKPFGVE